jgi:hypothetical protein
MAKSKGKGIMNKWIKLLLVVCVVLVALLGALNAFFTYGELWSIYDPVHSWLFNTMPKPPGYLPETDFINLGHGMSTRSYHVEMNHAEAVDFFINELPHSDWELVKKREGEVTDVGDVTPGAYRKSTAVIFVYRQWCWLSVVVTNNVNKEGSQVDPYPLVMMKISTDQRLITW